MSALRCADLQDSGRGILWWYLWLQWRVISQNS